MHLANMGAAMDALERTFEPHVFEYVLLFADDSSQVAICGKGESDIANMAELDDHSFGSMTTGNNVRLQEYLYNESGSREDIYGIYK